MANTQILNQGYGSYLSGILPDDIATAAGSFSVAMQQIKNISAVDFEKFAQVVFSLETTNGLPQINGSNVPVDTSLAATLQNTIAKGSGPYGTYTMSDMFGCMTGLPYMWDDILAGITQAQTQKLANIYHELYLAVTWAGAVPTVNTVARYVRTNGVSLPAQFDWYYDIVITFPNGGGYGRGTAPNPTMVLSPNRPGANIVAQVVTDTTYVGTAPGTFGRLVANVISPGSYVFDHTTNVSMNQTPDLPYPTPPTDETATLQYPPTATLAVQSNGSFSTSGVNTVNGTDGWTSLMNPVIQAYIDQANAEITNIATTKVSIVESLNVAYSASGTQLTVEQRARYSGISPVPSPVRDTFMNTSPSSIYTFSDAITTLSHNTMPHMYAQTLEAISDLDPLSGQSVVGMMRQERNYTRLQQIGITPDTQIPSSTKPKPEQLIISNGTAPTALPGMGITINGINGNKNNPITTFTVPSVLRQYLVNGQVSTPTPAGYFDPNTNSYKIVDPNTLVPASPLQEMINAGRNNTNNTNILGPKQDGTGPSNGNYIAIIRATTKLPTTPGTPLDVGKASVPGSFAGSTVTTLIPTTLNAAYTSGTLLPASFNVSDAINEVIRANCDCWVM